MTLCFDHYHSGNEVPRVPAFSASASEQSAVKLPEGPCHYVQMDPGVGWSGSGIVFFPAFLSFSFLCSVSGGGMENRPCPPSKGFWWSGFCLGLYGMRPWLSHFAPLCVQWPLVYDCSSCLGESWALGFLWVTWFLNTGDTPSSCWLSSPWEVEVSCSF